MDARAETSEQRRLAALEATALLDTPTERVFDRLTEVAAATLGVPIALISLVTDDRQFFKRQCGLPKPVADDRETPLAHSFCQHVVQDRAPLVIEDAREDARLHDNLAIRDLGVSAYAGVPLMLPDGAVIGSFCAIDTSPHRFDESDIAVLNGSPRPRSRSSDSALKQSRAWMSVAVCRRRWCLSRHRSTEASSPPSTAPVSADCCSEAISTSWRRRRTARSAS